jgi:predicted class III extradiol MEMO1 family dioxygenase
VIDELDDSGKFNWMKSIVDKEEHSLEMHLPFVYKAFEE